MEISKSIVVLFLVCYLSAVQNVDGECVRPSGIVPIEEHCYESTYGVLEKAQRTVTGFFDKAKKQLGIGASPESPEIDEPKKCQYYQCVLRKLMVINQYDLPDIEAMRVLYSKTPDVKDIHYENLDYCQRILKPKLDPPSLDARADENAICEISSDVMKCVTVNTDACPLFKFP